VDRQSLHGIRKGPAEVESGLDDDDDDLDGIPPEKEGYPYSIVPILQTPSERRHSARLIRVLSFDPTAKSHNKI